METLLIQIAIVTDMENIIYPENQFGEPFTLGKLTANKLIAIYSATNNNFKSIISKAVFYRIFFLLDLSYWWVYSKPGFQFTIHHNNN
jgi:hypothetical protein